MNRFSMTLACVVCIASTAHGDDWPRFRGPGGMGVAPASSRPPTTWDGMTNITWKTPLPGPGASSPVTYGKHAYVTCYSGYGLSKEDPGNKADLKRHLVCVRLADGGIEWSTTVPVHEHEHPYNSYITSHGYASSTPVVDATGVYVYFGTAGLIAYDHKGNERWKKSCGTHYYNFGTAASPILYKDFVIVNADVEDRVTFGLHKRDGTEVWKFKPVDWETNTWDTPLIVPVKGVDEMVCFGDRSRLVGLDPSSGKTLWTCKVPMQSYQCPSQVAHDGVVYAIGNHPGNAVAVRLGGRGDVTASHKVWDINKGSVVSSPIYHDGHLYWAKEESSKLYCVEAASGKVVYEERLEPAVNRMYASPILAGGNLYYVSQTEGTFVVEAKPSFKLVARNVIDSDKSIFNGSPAVSGNSLLLRSDSHLYCISAR